MTNVGTDPRARQHQTAPRAGVEPEIAEELAKVDRDQWNVITDPATGTERQAKRSDITYGLPADIAREVLPLVPSTLPPAQAFQRLERLRKTLADVAEGTRVVAETPAKRAALADELAQLRHEREAERVKVETWEPSDGEPPSHVPLMRWDRLIRKNRAADAALADAERGWTISAMSGAGNLARAEDALPELIAAAVDPKWWGNLAMAHQGTYASWEAAATRNAMDYGKRRVEERRRREMAAREAAHADAQEAARQHVAALATRVATDAAGA